MMMMMILMKEREKKQTDISKKTFMHIENRKQYFISD